jgi:tetratricopeptide (TPR) repeat protein
MKKRLLFVFILTLQFSAVVLAQKTMLVQDDNLGLAVVRCDDNETVVIVRSPLELTFESTMDKAVNVYNTEQGNGFNKYYLKFSTLPKYKGRKLKINSYGFDPYTYPLDLVAKTPVGILVVDPNGTVGVAAWRIHTNQGDSLYAKSLYEDARIKYLDALECSDLPEDNIVAQKINNAVNCAENRQAGETYFNNQDWLNAKASYEKVVALNGFDELSKSRIDQCNEYVGNQPRQLNGVVTDQAGQPLQGVTIKAQYVKEKKGKVEIDDKTGKPKTEYKAVGKTEADGRYAITVLNKSKYLQFSKGSLMDSIKYKTANAEIVADTMNIAMERGTTILDITKAGGDISTTITDVTNSLSVKKN